VIRRCGGHVSEVLFIATLPRACHCTGTLISRNTLCIAPGESF
jgi:hypothetical protein